MFVAGIDAHTRYVVVTVLNRFGEQLLKPTRVRVEQPERLLGLLAPYRPLAAVMETKLARAIYAMLRTNTPWRNEQPIRLGVSSLERMPH